MLVPTTIFIDICKDVFRQRKMGKVGSGSKAAVVNYLFRYF